MTPFSVPPPPPKRLRPERAGRERSVPRQGQTPRLLALGLAVALLAVASAAWLLRPASSLPKPHLPAPEPAPPAGPFAFRDITPTTGIGFVHTHGGFGKLYIVEAMTAGLALFDYDGDGNEDIYFLNGAPLPLGQRHVDPPPRNALYRGLGDGRFLEATNEAGLGDTRYALGVAVADYDNDGDLDVFVTNFGPDALFRNNGDGTFTEVTAQAGVADATGGDKIGAGACWLDMDGDGHLDLFSANYVKFSYDINPSRRIGGISRAPSPLDFEPQPSNLYRNNGDGTFTDVSGPSGIGAHPGSGMGVTAFDYDDDGDTDIFVCNDVRGNFLFRNDGNGKFTEVALEAGVAYDAFGKANGSMGADAADYDNDGDLDLFMTDYQAEMPCLYHNLGRGLFEDVAIQSGVGAGCLQHVKWGAGFADFDNDGWRDLFVANGHIEPKIELIDPTTAYRAPNTVLRNLGDGTFRNVSDSAGEGLEALASSRGLGLADLDHDGRIDVVILNSEDKPTVLRNETLSPNHWLQIRLRGTHSNRDGIGARVRVVAGQRAQIDEVHSGRAYQSHYGLTLHFGLGSHRSAERIEVHWIGGQTDTFTHLPADQIVTLVEGTGR